MVNVLSVVLIAEVVVCKIVALEGEKIFVEPVNVVAVVVAVVIVFVIWVVCVVALV